MKRVVNAHKKCRSTLELASGDRGQRSRLYRKAKEQMLHSLNYALPGSPRQEGRLPAALDYPDQRRRPRERYDLLIQPFHQCPKAAGVAVDRKILSELAISDPAAFSALAEVTRANVPVQRDSAGTAA